MAPFDGMSDLCIHPLGPTADKLPSSFGGVSRAGMWQVRFEGDNGMPKRIHELFFSGILVAESSAALMSRGPDALYNTFLPYLNAFSN